MTALLRFLIWLPISYALASLAAGYTIYAAWQVSGAIPGDSDFELILGGLFTSLVFASLAAIPSLIAIIATEIAAKKGLITHLLVGLVNGFVVALATSQDMAAGPAGEPFLASLPTGYETYLTGGAAWGLVWWVLAGRQAGQR